MHTGTQRRTSRFSKTVLAATATACLTTPMLAGSAAFAATDESATASPVPQTGVVDVDEAPRTIITTDPELDDLNSMLRMLLYSNEINIVGLVYSSSQHHYEGDPENGVEPFRWPHPEDIFHIDTAVNAYAEVYDNLSAHDASYPTPDSLRGLIRWGNVKTKGDMSGSTEGSNLIKEVLLDDEPGQVFLQAWGGANTIAQALSDIQADYEGTPEWDAIHEKVQQKAVLTSFGQQDDTFVDYIRPNWPELEHREVSTNIWGYGARRSALPEWQQYLSPEWTAANVSSVGPMGAEYRVWGDGKFMADGFDAEDYFGFSEYTADELRDMGYMVWTNPQPKGAWISEGDSSNFALLIQNGLRNYQDPSWGGWGGRQAQNPDDPFQWRNRGVSDIGPDGEPRDDYSAARWFEDFQLDFAARLQWTTTADVDTVNHAPDSWVSEGIDLTAAPGEHATLHGIGTDIDGDEVSFDWYQYQEAGTYDGDVELSQTDDGQADFTVPEDAQVGDTLHFILEVADPEGLKAYQRVVVTIDDETQAPLGVELSTHEAAAGDEIDVDIEGLEIGEEASIELHSAPVTLALVNGDGEGRASATVTIPASTEAGEHTIVVTGESSGRIEVPLTITAPSAPDDGSEDQPGDDDQRGDNGTAGDDAQQGDDDSVADADELAVTGSDIATTAGIAGIAALMIGAGAFAFARSRRTGIQR